MTRPRSRAWNRALRKAGTAAWRGARHPRRALWLAAWGVVAGRDAQVTYSQDGEDRVLARLFEHADPGFYVDIGAHHPTRFSNTAVLYRAGWHGINVDPRPGTRRLFEKERSSDITLELGVAGTQGTLSYYVFNDQGLNTFSRARADDLEATTDYHVTRRLTIPTLTLSAVLDRYLPPGQQIDLLSIDVEGLDLEVLRSNDWQRYQPRIVITEDLENRTRDLCAETPSVEFLRGVGYSPIAKTGNSVFFACPQFGQATSPLEDGER